MTDVKAGNPLAIWHGMDRKGINWHPTIDEDKCTGCSLCVVTCGEKRNVFGYDSDNRKAVVMFPDNCMVGCNNCGVACLFNAITFPDILYLKSVLESIPRVQIEKELQKKINDNPSLLALAANALHS
ncbi:MAG: 4Fe-4S dicluster domain-containing protein [Thermoplasmata archaeon]